MSTPPAGLSQDDWQVSSRCSNGNCVQVARTPRGTIALGDSKDTHGPALEFPLKEWRAFVQAVKAGRMDL
ncbi:DUF397 domain-containing protein [Microbispora sp. H10836]|uniref:DUF397 domain-containing protein n=1 Tax=Microbispora sp. H10836 TaxID=2729106 RepID=UPI001473F517|nr:DUF397 domain-containing protein [Microbispora sp. H10836]